MYSFSTRLLHHHNILEIYPCSWVYSKFIFLLLSTISLYDSITVCLSTFLLMDTWAVSRIGSYRQSCCDHSCISLWEHRFSFLLGKSLALELQCHRVVLKKNCHTFLQCSCTVPWILYFVCVERCKLFLWSILKY